MPHYRQTIGVPKELALKIREAVPGDAAAATRVARAAKASWGYPEEWLREWEEELTITPTYIRDNSVFVAESSGEIVGMVAVEVGPEAPEIGHLWVRPPSQGNGWGRALIARIRQHGKDLGWNHFRVVSDPFAESFYRRLGGVRVGEVDAPVNGSERRLPVMMLSVAG
ncbi:MAG: GNAT family N-acetyltransferase [Rhodothermales bacterium]|nr:GNAT family N-acetyltransferase [Rhodothermales bacterium]